MKLATTYLGLKLRTPLVPSASPLSEKLDNIKRMEDAGASAVVFHSLFEEQLRPGNLSHAPRLPEMAANSRLTRSTIIPTSRTSRWIRRPM